MTTGDLNLYTAFARQFPADGSAPLLHLEDGTVVTYGEAAGHSARAAGWLLSLGLRPGDRVTAQIAKSPEALWLYLGCLRAGLVFQPLNDGYRPDELGWFLADARPSLIVCGPDQLSDFQTLARGSSALIHTLDGRGGGTAADALRARGAIQQEPVHLGTNDVAIMLYSSGTTGRPKGALITHGNLVSNARSLVDAWGFTAADRLLHALPVYHAHGLFVGVGCTLMSGASMTWLPRFDAGTVIRHLPACTVMMGVPTYYTRLLAMPAFGRAACGRVRLFISGSAPLLPDTFTAFEARTGQRILERYGMTETGMNTANPLHGERRPGSVGLPLPGVAVRIAAEAGSPLPPGRIGEIQLRGPNVFAGYWRQPEQTALSFTADGWFRTGDQGRLDADGYLWIVGRSKDLIITGGLNVYPREVEQVIDSLPGVAESAVIGVPYADFGEGVIAVVVPAVEQPADEAAIVAAARDRLAAFKVPKRVFFASELPRNAMGKVRKDLLRRRFASVLS